jgi:hypothetical protein
MSTEISPLKANIFTDYNSAADFVAGRPKGYAGSQQNFE